MKKLYRVYFDGLEGEYTLGYIELTKSEYNKLEAINEDLHAINKFELEEVVVSIKFKAFLHEKLKDLEDDRKMDEEKEKDDLYVTMRDKALKKFNRAMKKLDEEYDESGEDSFEYITKKMEIIATLNDDMSMVEMSYISHKMLDNFKENIKDGNNDNSRV